jgi:hypothetical protein
VKNYFGDDDDDQQSGVQNFTSLRTMEEPAARSESKAGKILSVERMQVTLVDEVELGGVLKRLC